MPATGREQNAGDITQVEPNIHAALKYMHATADAFFKDGHLRQQHLQVLRRLPPGG
jgi:hypothetical protein